MQAGILYCGLNTNRETRKTGNVGDSPFRSPSGYEKSRPLVPRAVPLFRSFLHQDGVCLVIAESLPVADTDHAPGFSVPIDPVRSGK